MTIWVKDFSDKVTELEIIDFKDIEFQPMHMGRRTNIQNILDELRDDVHLLSEEINHLKGIV